MTSIPIDRLCSAPRPTDGRSVSRKDNRTTGTNKENFKFSKATNQSVVQSKGELLLILNNDIVLQKNSLNFLLEKIKDNDAVIPQLVYPNGIIQKSVTGLPKIKDIFYVSIGLNKLNKKYDKWMLNNFDYQKEQLIFDQPCFSAILIKKTTWNKVGKLDENFPLLWNDTDWFFRFQKIKLKCLYIPKAKVIHIHGMSVNKHRFNKIKESTISMKKYFIKNSKTKIYDRIFLDIICIFTFIVRFIREMFFTYNYQNKK